MTLIQKRNVGSILNKIVAEINLFDLDKNSGHAYFFMVIDNQFIAFKRLDEIFFKGIHSLASTDMNIFQVKEELLEIIYDTFASTDNLVSPSFICESVELGYLQALQFSIIVGNEPESLTIGLYYQEEQKIENCEQDRSFLLRLETTLSLGLKLTEERLKNEYLVMKTKKLYTSIDVEEILQTVYDSVVELYPQLDVHFWMSHDYDVNLPVKKLQIQGQETDKNKMAFVTGETFIYKIDNKQAISIPLSGKQGNYGVLQFIQISDDDLAETEISFISSLADAVGTAVESANLYAQSQKLIKQLKLINDTSQELIKKLNVTENIEYMFQKIMEIFQPEDLHFFLYREGKYTSVASTQNGILDAIFESEQCAFIHEFHRTKAPIYDVSNRVNSNILQGDTLYQSVMMVPISHAQEVEGLIIALHREPHFFSYEDFRLFSTLVHHASLALINSSLHQKVNKMVITDHLTKLYTRSYLDQEILSSMKKDQRGSFILLDIDDFKKVNDTYGHLVGDDILVQCSNAIKSSIRDSDIAARWGGEELAIYLPMVHIERAAKIASRINELVQQITSPQVTISCGVSEWQMEGDIKESDHLFQSADRCLYMAKREGKNKVIVCDGSAYEELRQM